MPKFLIHIIGLNRLDMTRRCVESVIAAGGDYLFFLTDNGSTDGTLDYFREVATDSANAILIHNDENLGFIFPNNRAFAFAAESQIPYFIALNNDTEVSPGWLEKLAAPLDADENSALSGPRGTCCSLHDNMHGFPGPHFEYVEGSCLCAKVELVSKYGPLFSDYLDFIYGDDSDLSLRMREKGHKIHQVDFELKHTQGSTVEHSPEVKAQCQAAQVRNHQVLLKRWAHYLKVRRFDYPIILRRQFALGDVLLLTPIIRAIARSNPLSPILVETDTPELFKNNPDVCAAANFIPSDHPQDLPIDLNMAYENRPGIHIIDAYAEAVREKLPGLGPVEKKMVIFPSEKDREWANNLREEEFAFDKLCVMHMGPTDWPGKNWPIDNFALLAGMLIGKGWKVAVVGKKRPWEPLHGLLLDLTGKTSPLQLAALLEKAKLFVGIDSFPLHCAQAVGCLTIGIFGVTSAKFIMTDSPGIGINADPLLPCAGQRHRETGKTFVSCDPICIQSITVQRVLKAVEEIIK